MIKEEVIYKSASTQHFAQIFCLDYEKRPAVLIAPSFAGQDQFTLKKAEKLAEMGYVGVALDVYGNHTSTKDEKVASQLMMPLFKNRKELRERMVAGFNAVSNLSYVDADRMAAIGFCFGGLCVTELLLSGQDVRGVASFHGVFTDQMGGNQAILEPDHQPKGAFLGLHGAEDPLAPWSDIIKFTGKLTKFNVDWEFDFFGHAAHAFTNPEKHDKKNGLAYDEKASNRAFAKLDLYLKEIFK